MENLKALVYKGDLTPYQRALAQREFKDLVERLELLEKAVKNNAVLPHVSNQLCDCKDFTIKEKMLVCKKCGKEHKSLSA